MELFDEKEKASKGGRKRLKLEKHDKGARTVGTLEMESKTTVENFSEFIGNFKAQYDIAHNGSDAWRSKQDVNYKKRYGIRPQATFPWWGASNLHLPLQDKTIRKLKPEYVGLIWNNTPICEISPVAGQDQDRAERNSWHLDWLIRTEMKIFPELCLISDRVMQNGFYIAKTIYEKRTEPRTIVILREELEAKIKKELMNPDDQDILSNPAKIETLFQIMSKVWDFDREDDSDNSKMLQIATEIYKGTKEFEFTVDAVVYDAPKVIPLNPADVTVPTDTQSDLDLEKARWIDHKYSVTPQKLWEDALSGKFNKKVAEEVLKKKGYKVDKLYKEIWRAGNKTKAETEIIKADRADREGISNDERSPEITLHELCLWYDADNDGKAERHILDYCDDYLEDALRFIKYPLEMLCWPYVKVPFEITDGRHYSPRGTIEIQNPVANAMNVQENQKINRQTLATTPTMLYNADRFNPDNLTFIPGQPVPVDGNPSEAVAWMEAPGSDQSYAAELAFLKQWGEEEISSLDIASPLNLAGKNKMDMKYLQSISQDHISTRQLDLQIFQAAWALIFERIWSLEMQYGPDWRVSPVDDQGNSAKITKGEMFGKYIFSCGGRFGVTSPLLEAQKAQMRLQEFANDPYVDQYELRRDVIARQDQRLAKRLMKPKGQAEQEMAQAQQMEMQMATMGIKKHGTPSRGKSQQISGGSAGQHNPSVKQIGG